MTAEEREEITTYLNRNWRLTLEAGNEAVRDYRGPLCKRDSRHFRARKEQLLRWTLRAFPGADEEEVGLMIDDIFVCPAGFHYGYPAIPRVFIDNPNFCPLTGTISQ